MIGPVTHFRDAQVFVLGTDPLFNIGDVRRVEAAFQLTEAGIWLSERETAEHKLSEFNGGPPLYRVVHDCVSHRRILMIFDKAVAAQFKLQFGGV